MDIGYYNGRTGPLSEMTIPLNDRVVFFGDGVYDATMAFNGIILDLADHMERFRASLEKLSIPAPMPAQALSDELVRIAQMGEKDTWYMLYWSATRGTAPRSHAFPENTPSNLIITLTQHGPMQDHRTSLRLITFEDRRFSYCDVKTLNLIPSCLAAQAAKEAGCDEAVFHRGEIVTECAHSNISILRSGVFVTAPVEHWILPGIARKNLIRSARAAGIPVEERYFTLQELFGADEIIVSSSSGQLLPAAVIDGKKVGGRAPALLEKLAGTLSAYINAQFGTAVL